MSMRTQKLADLYKNGGETHVNSCLRLLSSGTNFLLRQTRQYVDYGERSNGSWGEPDKGDEWKKQME